jgi:sialate O-acetylesterase
MVLQRAPQRANIWGWAKTPGAVVTVTINQKSYNTTSALSTGAWNILLDPTPAGGPYTLEASSTSGDSAALSNILFGDVYVCSGQSNMQFTVHSAFNASTEIIDANNYPNIRLFSVGQGTSSIQPLSEFSTISQLWSIASASTVGVGDWSEFSAVCWFFGRDLYDNLRIPIGLFSDNWGGTIVQAWSSPDALKVCPTTADTPGGPNDPSNLWNAMIVPVLPMTITGATWYQGESNSGNANYYACAFPEMIKDWRLKWGGDTSKTFPFYFVQLATWSNNNDLNSEALLRLSQVYATQLPKVGLATAMDSGDPSSPFGDIHPRSKQIVGSRLSLTARAIGYGSNIQYKGPEATQWTIINQSPSASVRITFSPDSIGGGLVITPKACYTGVTANQCRWADIGTQNGQWTNATITISGDTIVLSANIASGSQVTGVRYAWANYPVAVIYNKDGLPALPFAFPNPIKPTRK